MTLLEAARAFCLQQGTNKTYWIAYSGGLDSHVLLHVFACLRATLPLQLHAIHVNHGLSVNAPGWAQHCQQICQALQVPYEQYAIKLKISQGESLENLAREKRYKCLAQKMHQSAILLTAHHQDDQAETVLLQLLRGAGLKGLAAMPQVKPFATGLHARPFLNFSRADLLSYAKDNQLNWVDDESNSNIQFSRNLIRHEIMPLVKRHWPAVAQTLSRAATHCAEASDLLDGVARDLLQLVTGNFTNTLSVEKLKTLDAAKQRLVLRAWIQAASFPLPPMKKLEALRHGMLQAGRDRMPSVTWCDVVVRRFRDDIFLLQQHVAHDTTRTYDWQLDTILRIEGHGELQAVRQTAAELRSDMTNLKVSFRQGGEAVKLPRRGTRTLKKLWQEWGVPTWLRDRLPLLYDQEMLVCIPGVFIHPAYIPAPNETGWRVMWRQL
jgi:tRNA(Ile)-lysidine synthase